MGRGLGARPMRAHAQNVKTAHCNLTFRRKIGRPSGTPLRTPGSYVSSETLLTIRSIKRTIS